MGALSRRKGVAWERQVARQLSATTGHVFERVLTESRTGNSGDVRSDRHPLVVQAKSGKAPSPWKALSEAVAVSAPHEIPVGILHRDRAPGRQAADVAVLRLDDFLALLTKVEAP